MSDSTIGSRDCFPDISRLRVDYRARSLSESDVDPNPIVQFSQWLHDAISAGANEPNAMTLATCGPEGAPSARIVLLKGIDEEGMTFFTNYSSQKGRELDADPRAALVFWWVELERQVRIQGTVSHTSDAESDHYFNQRPLESRIGAAASPQSARIESRQVLEASFARIRAAHPDGIIPRPANWGGYRLRPTQFEFWQGRPSRLHDRIEYLCESEGNWIRRRLAP